MKKLVADTGNALNSDMDSSPLRGVSADTVAVLDHGMENVVVAHRTKSRMVRNLAMVRTRVLPYWYVVKGGGAVQQQRQEPQATPMLGMCACACVCGLVVAYL